MSDDGSKGQVVEYRPVCSGGTVTGCSGGTVIRCSGGSTGTVVGCSNAGAPACSPVGRPRLGDYGGSAETRPRGDALSIRDSVNVYLLAREEVRQCLECAGCNHQYMWPWPPLPLHPPPFLPPATSAATHLRLQLLPSGQDWAGLAAWHQGFTVESLLAPRDAWPLHLPPHFTPHLPTPLTPHLPTQLSTHPQNNGMVSKEVVFNLLPILIAVADMLVLL